ncbi:MAG: lysophospholipid acyltransferase family protein [Acidobacteriota bacterium]
MNLMGSNRFYFSLLVFIRLIVNFFFREVSVRNAQFIPKQGPLLLTLNHPNNLLDSVLIGAVMPRKVHFLATAMLFRNRLIAALLNAAGAVPVYRAQEGQEDRQQKNQQTFARVVELLQTGNAVAIYPEGVTHSDPFLHKIKTGAARIALQAEAKQNFQLGLRIMPVGLNFLTRKSFRRRVTINFGSPREIGNYADSYRTSERDTVSGLTTELQEAMEDQILNIERAELQLLIKEVEKVYMDYLAERLRAEGKPERAEDFTLRQRIIEAVNFYYCYFPERFEQLRDALLNYTRRRDYLNVPEKAFKSELREGFSSGLYTRLLLEGILGAPIFLYGASQNLLPYLLPRLLSHFNARKETDYATIRLLASMFAFPLFYILQMLLCAYYFSPLVAFFYLLSLPLTGMYAIRYLHGIKYFRRKIHILYLFLSNRNLLEKLAQDRESIIAQLNEARAEFLKITTGEVV